MVKPVHKFNGGLGATLCNKCRVIITTGHTDDTYCDKCLSLPPKYILERVNDSLIKKGDKVLWLKWKDPGLYKRKLTKIEVGTSLYIINNRDKNVWLTSPVKEIFVNSKNYIEFYTENSHYKLHANVKK